jgi:cyanophycinase
MKTNPPSVCPVCIAPQSSCAAGHLLIIGGGERPVRVMRRIVELAGGAQSRIVILPTASEAPIEVALAQKAEFEALGAGHVDFIHCSREDADTEPNLAKMARATGVFFSGGDQRKLAATLLGTRLLASARSVYLNGGVIAGTSAGAAVMSRIMITGDEEPEGAGAAARTIQTSSGFGFLPRAIIDQHFVKRGRHYRLQSLVARHPDHLGIGIDEATAIVVSPDHTFTTIGDSQVLVFGASERGTQVADAQPESPRVSVEILASGAKYCLRRQQVC